MRTAVQAAPSDVPLRRHLAELLAEHGALDEAIQHAAAALHTAPADDASRALMRRLLAAAPGSVVADPAPHLEHHESPPAQAPLGLHDARGLHPQQGVPDARGPHDPWGAQEAAHSTDGHGFTAGPLPPRPAMTPRRPRRPVAQAYGAAPHDPPPAGHDPAVAAPAGPVGAPAGAPTGGRNASGDAPSAPAGPDSGPAGPDSGPDLAPIDALLAMREDQLSATTAARPADQPGTARGAAGLERSEADFVPDIRWAAAGDPKTAAVARVVPGVPGGPAEPGEPGGRSSKARADLLAALSRAAPPPAGSAGPPPRSAGPASAPSIEPPLQPVGSGAPDAPDAPDAATRLAWDVEPVTMTLADVGGMDIAKERLEAAVLAPARHPELRRLYRQSLTGGVLLYGPPGCGKAFLARAVAGELGARFVGVRLREIVEPGSRTDSADLGRIFEAARAQAPVLVLLEEVDVLSRRRDVSEHATRALERIAAELDSDATDAGVYVLATTAAPWDVDPALRQSGRLGRGLLVMPPDQQARETILRQELARVVGTVGGSQDLPLHEVALLSQGYSCTDLEWLTTLAASAAAKSAVPLTQAHLRAMLARVPASTEPWIQEAARIAAAHPADSLYSGLREYLRTSRRH